MMPYQLLSCKTDRSTTLSTQQGNVLTKASSVISDDWGSKSCTQFDCKDRIFVSIATKIKTPLDKRYNLYHYKIEIVVTGTWFVTACFERWYQQ